MPKHSSAKKVSQNRILEKSPNLKGNLQYSITIPQLGVVANHLLDKTDVLDWIVLDYVRSFVSSKRAKAITKEGKRFVWINYVHLRKSLPIIKVKSKHALSRRVQKLAKLGLLEVFRARDNTLFARLTDLALGAYHTKPEKLPMEDWETENDTPYDTKSTQGYDTESSYPYDTESTQHNNISLIEKSLINNLCLSFNRVAKISTAEPSQQQKGDRDNVCSIRKNENNNPSPSCNCKDPRDCPECGPKNLKLLKDAIEGIRLRSPSNFPGSPDPKSEDEPSSESRRLVRQIVNQLTAQMSFGNPNGSLHGPDPEAELARIRELNRRRLSG
jgi:hypothetical protein